MDEIKYQLANNLSSGQVNEKSNSIKTIKNN